MRIGIRCYPTYGGRLHGMAKAARFEAQARFYTRKIIPKYEEFYRGVLEREP